MYSIWRAKADGCMSRNAKSIDNRNSEIIFLASSSSKGIPSASAAAFNPASLPAASLACIEEEGFDPRNVLKYFGGGDLEAF